MEACAGAHDWGRKLMAMGHRVQLLPAQHVKPFNGGRRTIAMMPKPLRWQCSKRILPGCR